MERDQLTLRIRNLQKTYSGNVEAVRGIDVDVENQRIFALLGPNGAGKTTVLKSILGLVNYSGSVEVLGRPIDEVRERISFVPEEKNLYENLDIESTLRLSSRISPRFNEKQARELIENYKLPYRKKIRTFSNGMKTGLCILLLLYRQMRIYIFSTSRHGASIL